MRTNLRDYGPEEEPEDTLRSALEEMVAAALDDNERAYEDAMDALLKNLRQEIASQARQEAYAVLVQLDIVKSYDDIPY